LNSAWYAVPGLWGYGAAALAFAGLAARLLVHWQPGGKPAMLLGMAIATAVAAGVAAAFSFRPTEGLGWATTGLELLRVTAMLGFLLAFLGVRNGATGGRRGGTGWAPLAMLGLVLVLAQLLFAVRQAGAFGLDPVGQRVAFGSALAVGVFGLLLVEQCYRRTPAGSRWHVRPLLLGLAGVFAFDVVLYSDALLFRALDFDLWAARGFAQALTVPLILTTLQRGRDWSFELTISRGVIAGSTALLLSGGYLLLVASAGFLIRQFGGSWGRALESVLLFGAVLLLAAVVSSRTFRAKVRVLVAKHFFTYRYDYRQEWLRLTSTLASGAAASPWLACIHALGELVESPGGALWFRTNEGDYRQVEQWNLPINREPLGQSDALPSFLRKTGWVLDLEEVKKRSEAYDNLTLPAAVAEAPDAWIVVPLLTAHELVGFVVLTTPRVQIELDWEVLDLLKTAGRQTASYLAYAQATEALLEAQKFDAFHRMSTFVVHDLKNLIAQLQLLLSNAERHRDNPDFQRDMLKTIEHVVGRMHQLTLQLRPEATATDRIEPVDVAATARRVQAHRMDGRSGLSVEAGEGVLAWAHEDLLERVIAHLVQNAFDASEGDQASVKVRVEHDGDTVLIEVSDRGKGMTAEFIRDRLFRPFQTTKETGMGIGVFECHQYVHQVGGSIAFESTPGEGTRVRVRLRAVGPTRSEVGVAA
jgi:putative PEP-CTERM system histidine kinase